MNMNEIALYDMIWWKWGILQNEEAEQNTNTTLHTYW